MMDLLHLLRVASLFAVLRAASSASAPRAPPIILEVNVDGAGFTANIDPYMDARVSARHLVAQILASYPTFQGRGCSSGDAHEQCLVTIFAGEIESEQITRQSINREVRALQRRDLFGDGGCRVLGGDVECVAPISRTTTIWARPHDITQLS